MVGNIAQLVASRMAKLRNHVAFYVVEQGNGDSSGEYFVLY